MTADLDPRDVAAEERSQLMIDADNEEPPEQAPKLTPGSPAWARRVSASKVAPILGVSPWDSQRSMWHKMRGEVPWDEETEAMERGTLCEPAVLTWWRKHFGVDQGPYREQVTLTIGDWCVATPDALCDTDDGLVLVEAKTTANMGDWGEPGTDQIPAYYLCQVYFAMEVARRNGLAVIRADVPVLGGPRLLFSRYVVPYDAAIGASLLDRMKTWYDSLSSSEPPDLDDSFATYDAVRKVHRDIEPKVEVEIPESLAIHLAETNAASKSIAADLRLAKSEVITRMERAQYAVCNGVRVARRQPDGPERTKFVVVAKPEHFLEEKSA